MPESISANLLIDNVLYFTVHLDILGNGGVDVRFSDEFVVPVGDTDSAGAADGFVLKADEMRRVAPERHRGAVDARQREVLRGSVAATGCYG